MSEFSKDDRAVLVEPDGEDGLLEKDDEVVILVPANANQMVFVQRTSDAIVQYVKSSSLKPA